MSLPSTQTLLPSKPQMSTSAAAATAAASGKLIPPRKVLGRNLEKSVFEHRNGRTVMYTVGFILFTGGLVMSYFGYRAHEFSQKLMMVGNHTIAVQLEELHNWQHSQVVYRGYFSMQFIGPTLAAMGAFLVMLSVVGHFIHREQLILGRRRHRDYQVSQC